MRLLFSSCRGVGGVAFPTSCVFNRPDAPRPAPAPRSGLQVPAAAAAPRAPRLPRLNPPPGRTGSGWSNAAAATRTAPGAGTLCPGDIPKIAPGPSRALKIRLREEGCRRAHLAGTRRAERGGCPAGRGTTRAGHSPAGKGVSKERPVLNARVDPDGHTPACAQAPDPAAPLSIAAPPRAGECPRAGHTVPAPGTPPRHRAHRPRARHTARGPAQAPAGPALPSPARAARDFETSVGKTRRCTGLTAAHFILLFFFFERNTIQPRLPSPVQTAGPPLAKTLLYTKYIFVTKYNQ